MCGLLQSLSTCGYETIDASAVVLYPLTRLYFSTQTLALYYFLICLLSISTTRMQTPLEWQPFFTCAWCVESAQY